MTSEISDAAAQVLAVLARSHELSRAELSRASGLSVPTISSAIEELGKAELAERTRARQGELGRAASLYGISKRAGWLLGLDVGSTQIHVVARSLGGELLSEFRYETHGATSLAGDTLTAMAAQQVAQHVAELPAEHGPLRSIGIAVPHVVPNQPTPASMIRLGARGEAQLQELLSALAVPGDVPVVLENNVNCAALAEMTLGAAREWTDFVYLQIGVGIGAGIISDGRLHRGASGAAGEIAAIPFPWQPADPSGAQPGNLEEYLGSAGLMHRYWDSIDSERDPRASTVREVFERAQQGDPVARRSADVHASDVAALVRTLVAVLDPAQILLGGGVGQNQLFVSAVATALARDLPQIAVEVGELGVRATAEGATRLATEFAYSELLGARYQPILVNQNSVRAG